MLYFGKPWSIFLLYLCEPILIFNYSITVYFKHTTFLILFDYYISIKSVKHSFRFYKLYSLTYLKLFKILANVLKYIEKLKQTIYLGF